MYTLDAMDSSNVITKSKNLAQCTGYDKISMLASQSNQVGVYITIAIKHNNYVKRVLFFLKPIGHVGYCARVVELRRFSVFGSHSTVQNSDRAVDHNVGDQQGDVFVPTVRPDGFGD